jgi:hypothetical protein
MTEKLQWILERYVGPYHVRTIYDSDNQSVLIPTTERCSLHYFLMSQNTVWMEVYVYMYDKIPEFMIRKKFQTALIHVLEGSPLNIRTESEDWELQWYDGHYFFLDGLSGWLYFRNLRGDWNAWETTRDIVGMMGSKMGGKWDKRASSARIAVFTGDMEYILEGGGNPERCATLRVPGNKQTLLCMKRTIIVEVAAAALNFTTVYTYDIANRSGYPTGEISTSLSTEFDPDASLLRKQYLGLIQLSDVEYPKFVYCTYNRRSQSMSIAVWFLPFDVSCWIITVVLFCLFFLLQIISSGRLYTPQALSESILVIFRILFRQSVANK